MYEVELKVEVTADDHAALAAALAARGFAAESPATIHDHYVEAADSPHGGYDLKRYRDYGDSVVYTEKVWERAGDGLARRETEHEVERAALEARLAEGPAVVEIRKTRQSFTGAWPSLPGGALRVDMDAVKFDHSPAERYFVEAEVITGNVDEVTATKAALKSVLCELLGREVEEAPGMFMMALKRL